MDCKCTCILGIIVTVILCMKRQCHVKSDTVAYPLIPNTCKADFQHANIVIVIMLRCSVKHVLCVFYLMKQPVLFDGKWIWYQSVNHLQPDASAECLYWLYAHLPHLSCTGDETHTPLWRLEDYTICWEWQWKERATVWLRSTNMMHALQWNIPNNKGSCMWSNREGCMYLV